jgi:glucose dehydrogenase
MWDYEVGTHILIDGNVAGQTRKLITHSARNGFLYTFDRFNGESILAKPYTEVNWTKLLYIPALSNCITVSIDREKHNKERGWNGGLSQTDERWESNLTAVDPLSGEIKKNVHLRYPNRSGMLATGGGLVFLALMDFTVAAYADTTRDELWKINVGSGFSAPPMTFEVNGK